MSVRHPSSFSYNLRPILRGCAPRQPTTGSRLLLWRRTGSSVRGCWGRRPMGAWGAVRRCCCLIAISHGTVSASDRQRPPPPRSHPGLYPLESGRSVGGSSIHVGSNGRLTDFLTDRMNGHVYHRSLSVAAIMSQGKQPPAPSTFHANTSEGRRCRAERPVRGGGRGGPGSGCPVSGAPVSHQ